MTSDEGATAPLAFAMGGVVLVLVISSMLLAVQDIGGESATHGIQDASRRSQAEDLANLIISSPGLVDCGSTSPCSWDPPYPLADFAPDQYKLEGPSIWKIGDDASEADQDADNVIRLGLRSADGDRLDITKFRNLKDATYEDEVGGDDRVNYADVRQMFGLDEQNLDFHIRAYPALRSVDELIAGGLRDQHLRITYIGNAVGSGTGDYPTVESLACGVSPHSDQSWRYTLEIGNTGTTTTQFQAVLDIDDGSSGPGLEVKDQSAPVLPGSPGTPTVTTVYIDVPDDANGDCAAATDIDITLYDISSDITDPGLATQNPVPNGTTPGTTATHAFFIEVDKLHYATSDSEIAVQWDGTNKDDEVYWELRSGADGSGAVVDLWSDHGDAPEHANQAANRQFTIDVPVQGEYRLVAWPVDKNGVPGPAVSQFVLVMNNPDTLDAFGSGGGSVTFDPAVEREVAMLEQLMDRFCPSHYNSQDDSVMTSKPTGTAPTWTTWSSTVWHQRCDHKVSLISSPTFQPGDVFWDDKKLVMDEVCKRLLDLGTDTECKSTHDATLAITNVLVVGSNVDHNALTQGAFKWPLQKWVEAGGAVIAFGSPHTSTQWLQPIFHVGQTSSSGGLTTPDTSHPLLTTPNQLDYVDYDNVGKGWKYTGGAEDKFTDVVKQGGEPLTAVSDPGAFGGGTVVITTWRPYDVYGANDAGYSNAEGLNIMANFVNQGYRDLYLDYGAPIPEGSAVEPAFRFSQVLHEDLGLVQLNLALFVF